MKEPKLKPWGDVRFLPHERIEFTKYILNGIACPKCGRELYDDLSKVLTSFPPQTIVLCLGEDCNFKNSRWK